MASLRILIADEHYLKRYRLKSLLESHAEWTICAEASTGREAASVAKRLKPDIAILDISMPELNGLEATKKIRTDSPNTEILILSVHYSQQLIQEILDAGARGYILESDSDRDLVIAVETIANHELFPTPLTPASVDLPSTATSADQTEIEGMRRELAELIALVEQPFRQQSGGISEGKPDDLTVQDYVNPILEYANLWAPEESQDRMEEAPKIKQVIAVEDGASQSSVLHDVPSTFLRTFKLAIETVNAGLRTFWRRAIAVFSRISPSLQKLKRWLNAPMK